MKINILIKFENDFFFYVMMKGMETIAVIFNNIILFMIFLFSQVNRFRSSLSLSLLSEERHDLNVKYSGLKHPIITDLITDLIINNNLNNNNLHNNYNNDNNNDKENDDNDNSESDNESEIGRNNEVILAGKSDDLEDLKKPIRLYAPVSPLSLSLSSHYNHP
jgi:hypothetical protein